MEKWDAYDRQRKQIGVELVRGKTIPKGLFHLVVNVLVQDSKGAFLFVKRSQEKEIHPGVYEEQSHYDYYLASLDEIRPKVRYQEGETEGHSWVQREELLQFFETHSHFHDQKKLLEQVLQGNNLL